MIELVRVDVQDRPLGTMEKLAAHAAPGHLHRAFSVMLVNDEGQCLLQQRAASKYHFPGIWANTCCGHPGPDQDVAEAAAQRTFEELGLRPDDLAPAGTFIYRAACPISGLVEYEYDHVLIGRLSGEPTPDPDEVDDVRLISFDDLDAELARRPEAYSPWLGEVTRLARESVGSLAR